MLKQLYQGLTTHARYSDHYAVFGFDNGQLQHMDMRAPIRADNKMPRFSDPFCDGIGYIDFNSTGQCFVVGGYSE